ncbi:unnamed protein product [Angiostrongylus costaricensis]|uniref:HAD-like domain-containing protein n=1 Tax=Angiostrongylus costaricensis TaxID=334426 RepID=A0A158PDF8_ANGCS|nr:unnamed protein product [Angiostrongylus costaricensis]
MSKSIPGSTAVLVSVWSHGGKSPSDPRGRRVPVVVTTWADFGQADLRTPGNHNGYTNKNPKKTEIMLGPTQPMKIDHPSVQDFISELEELDVYFVSGFLWSKERSRKTAAYEVIHRRNDLERGAKLESPKMVIKAVVFDMGGVLIPTPTNFIEDLEQKNGFAPGSLLSTLHKAMLSEHFKALEKGEITAEDFDPLFTDLYNKEVWRLD